MTEQTPERTLTRRSVVKGAAWAAPVFALAVATPAATASGGDIGAYSLTGECGVLGLLFPGFRLVAGPEPMPAGTTITITGTGIANIGVITPSLGLASVEALGGTTRVVTLNSPLPANATLELRTALSLTVAFRLDASVALPTGYTATGAKPSGQVNSTLVLCTDT